MEGTWSLLRQWSLFIPVAFTRIRLWAQMVAMLVTSSHMLRCYQRHFGWPVWFIWMATLPCSVAVLDSIWWTSFLCIPTWTKPDFRLHLPHSLCSLHLSEVQYSQETKVSWERKFCAFSLFVYTLDFPCLGISYHLEASKRMLLGFIQEFQFSLRVILDFYNFHI